MADTDKTNIKKLISFIGNPNIAEELEEDQLLKLGSQVVEGFGVDWDSMADWREIIEKGLQLIKPEFKPKSEPWSNSANFKSPVIIDAALKFGDRASSELLRSTRMVKPKINGDDPEGTKLDRAERVATMMNWQLTQEMTEWVDEQDKVLYDLPYTGCLFKKSIYNKALGRNVSEVITYPAFAINQDSISLERARRFTQIIDMPKNEVIEKQRAGIWLDVDLSLGETEESIDQTQEDEITTFLEQQTYADLDGDGYEEPYIVTVQKSSATVVRIVARYGPEDILLKDEKNKRSALLSELIQPIEGPDGEQGFGIPVTDGMREVVRISPNVNITKYGFLRDPEGGFLDVGYFHLLTGFNAAINSGTNALLNASALSNMQGGFMARGVRKKMGTMRVKPGQWQSTDLPAQDLAQGFLPYQFKEPSPTLFSLVQLLAQTAQQTSASADLTQALGANAPATTTLALVQEQQASAGAIILRIYRSMTSEFKKLFKLNAQFMDPALYQKVLDDPDANFEEDFNSDDFDIIPVANPEVSSKIQRLQLAEAQMSAIPVVIQAQGNIEPIVKGFYEALGSQQVDEIFPELTPEQQEQQAAAQQEQANEQDKLLEIQIDHAERKQDNEDIKTRTQAEKDIATTVKTLEEAETENTKNLSDTYTASINIDQQMLGLQQQILELQQKKQEQKALEQQAISQQQEQTIGNNERPAAGVEG